MPTVNKTPREVVIVLVYLFLLIARRSCSHGTRQSSWRWWGGSQAWVVLPPQQMLSDTCTSPSSLVLPQEGAVLPSCGGISHIRCKNSSKNYPSSTRRLILSRCSWSAGSLPPPSTFHLPVGACTHTLATPALTPQQSLHPFDCLCYPLPPSE